MSEPVLIAIIVAIPPTVAGIVGIIVSLRNGDKVNDIHIAINSRFDEWIAETKKSSFAKGVKAQKDKQADK